MGLLGILTGNGKGKNSSNNGKIEDIRYLVHNHVFSDSLKGIHELIGEALNELGEKGPKLKNPQTNEQRYVTVNDYEMEYNAAVDRITGILHGISQKAGKEEFAKLREYCLDAIEEFGMGNADYAYLRSQVSILKDHPGKIGLAEKSVSLIRNGLKKRQIAEAQRIKSSVRLYHGEQSLEGMKKEHEASFHNIDGFLQDNFAAPQGLLYIFEKIREAYEKEGMDGAMDFAEALYLPFRKERGIQLPVKQEYADLAITLWDSGKSAESVNEFACRTNELIQLCVQKSAEEGNRLDVTNSLLREAFQQACISPVVQYLCDVFGDRGGDEKCS